MPANKSFRQVMAENRDYEKNTGERKTDIGGNQPRPMDTKALVKHMVATQLSRLGEEAGYETFEEADDFEDEDPEPPWASQYEVQDLTPEEEPFHVPHSEPLPDDLEGRTDTSDDTASDGVPDPEPNPDN